MRAWALHRRGVLDFDEAYYYILGTNLFSGNGFCLNGLSHTAFPPLYPALVGLASLFTSSIRLATSSVSAIAGALLPLPIYFLARDVHGRRAGGIAAVAAAVFPVLFFVAASGVAYPLRMYFGSEPLYVTLLVTAILFVWLFARRGGWRNATLAGLFFGLASLVRSEAPVVFSFVFLWLVIERLASRKLFAIKTLIQTALVPAVMLAVFSPFLIHVRTASGRWTLGAKLVNNARIRDTLYKWVHNDSGDFLAKHYSLNDSATGMEDPYWGESAWHRQAAAHDSPVKGGLSLVANPDWRWLPIFFRSFCSGPLPEVDFPLVPSYAWLFIAAGLFFGPWNAHRFRWWSLLFFNFAPMLLLAVSLYVLPRHELALVALLCIPLGKGLDGAATLVKRTAMRFAHAGEAFAGVLGLLPAALVCIALFTRGIDLNVAGGVYAGGDVSKRSQQHQRELAGILKDRIPEGKTLMCHQPWIALWSGHDWRVAPHAASAELLAYAVARGIEYAVLEPSHPAAGEALRPYLVARITCGTTYLLYDFTRGAGASP